MENGRLEIITRNEQQSNVHSKDVYSRNACSTKKNSRPVIREVPYTHTHKKMVSELLLLVLISCSVNVYIFDAVLYRLSTRLFRVCIFICMELIEQNCEINAIRVYGSHMHHGQKNPPSS